MSIGERARETQSSWPPASALHTAQHEHFMVQKTPHSKLLLFPQIQNPKGSSHRYSVTCFKTTPPVPSFPGMEEAM